MAVIPVAVVVTAFGIGIYEGYKETSETLDNVGLFEAYMEDYGKCGEYTSEAQWKADGNCAIICDTYFECRHDYLQLEAMVDDHLMTLHEDVYTIEEYETIYGITEYATNNANPGGAPALD